MMWGKVISFKLTVWSHDYTYFYTHTAERKKLINKYESLFKCSLPYNLRNETNQGIFSSHFSMAIVTVVHMVFYVNYKVSFIQNLQPFLH